MSLLIEQFGADLTDSAAPTTNGTVENEIRLHQGTSGQLLIWRWDGLLWFGYSASPVSGDFGGDPNFGPVSDTDNQMLLDTNSTTPGYYFSTQTGTNNNWTAIVAGAGGGGY